MIYDYHYWHYLTRPELLATHRTSGEMRKMKSRFFVLFMATIALFVFRNVYGFRSSSLVHVLTLDGEELYQVARFTSLASSVLYAVIYIFFILVVFSFLFAAFTEIPFKTFIPLQLIVAGLYVIEKAILTVLFVARGEIASLSIFSFGPLAHRWIDNEFLVFFFNQWSIFTFVIIMLQYRFIQSLQHDKKKSVLLVLGVHLFFLLMIAGVSVIPFDDVYRSLLGGGIR